MDNNTFAEVTAVAYIVEITQSEVHQVGILEVLPDKPMPDLKEMNLVGGIFTDPNRIGVLGNDEHRPLLNIVANVQKPQVWDVNLVNKVHFAYNSSFEVH